mmetsp:Transcript_42580/g.137250  ORF Transcript_42580/g.137250 Transcript_42580/m.137250 type:complete len:200 (+) Transcript_42580:1029-1628(+)
MSRFGLASNWRLISITISLAALPTDFIVMAENQYGSIEPTSKPAKVSGSSRSTVTLAPVSFSRVTKAPKRATPTRQAEPMAKPLPMAAVVLPAASSASVFSRTDGCSSHISAMPPALSQTGPYTSIDRQVARVASMPSAASEMPYMPARRCEPKMMPARMKTGRTTDLYPSASPKMMFVAAPVRQALATSCTGVYEKDV